MWFTVLLLVFLFGFVVFRGAPYVPTRGRDIKHLLDEIYPLGADDLLVDIGSGDGLVLRAAARKGARALGYELNPVLVVVSRLLSRRHQNIEVKLADFWLVSFPEATTVVYTFGDARDINKMALKTQNEASRLGKKLIFISYGFSLKDYQPVISSGPFFIYQINPLH